MKTQTFYFPGVNLSSAVPCMDSRGFAVDVDTQGFQYFSIHAVPTGSWSTGVMKVRRSNAIPGPPTWIDFASPISLTAAAPLCALTQIDTQFIRVETTTAEANVVVDLYVHLRTLYT